MEISDRGLAFPIIGVAVASVIVAAFEAISGHYPDPISIVNLYLLGIGTGLVIARFGRLGRFGGLLGMPWHEAQIEEALKREVARARQYDRDLSLMAVKPDGKARLDCRKLVRATDQYFGCRDGWRLIILPETDAQSAELLMRKMFGGQEVRAAVTTIDVNRPRQRMDHELGELLDAATRPEIISFSAARARTDEVASRESQALAS